MSNDKLRVLPRGTARVQNYGALLGAGVNHFHGWTLDRTIGKPFNDPDTKQPRRHAVYLKNLGIESVVEISLEDEHLGEYIKHLRDGDLWPADAASAAIAGVKFDPSFGGEHGAEEKAAQTEQIEALKKKHGEEKAPEPPRAARAPVPSPAGAK